MTRLTPFIVGLLCASLLFIGILLSLPANGEGSNRGALIIVSDFNGTDEYELCKAVAFYEYLESIGYDSDEIIFLSSENVSCRDDVVTIENILEAFEWLIDGSKQKTRVNIYITDNSHMIQTESFYQFTDGQVACSQIIDWIDQIRYDSLNYITLGNHSGLFGPQLMGSDRVIMSSMREMEESPMDHFNITRSLEDMQADTNQDGVVSFVEAFYNEKLLLLGSGQDPQMWLV
ncbi:MAG: hypothetical protein JXA22_01740 [Candidatus Thermoplasmatota archaeon]|nr:hypothetical protein [Candidatus Thermoplasmatota archaeon]